MSTASSHHFKTYFHDPIIVISSIIDSLANPIHHSPTFETQEGANLRKSFGKQYFFAKPDTTLQ
jgi:hypothetical protein